MLKVFKALSNEIRLKIILMLLEKNSCIIDIAKHFPKDFSVIYRHIKILENSGIIYIEKVGKKDLVCLKDPETIKKLLELAKKIEKSNE